MGRENERRIKMGCFWGNFFFFEEICVGNKKVEKCVKQSGKKGEEHTCKRGYEYNQYCPPVGQNFHPVEGARGTQKIVFWEKKKPIFTIWVWQSQRVECAGLLM